MAIPDLENSDARPHGRSEAEESLQWGAGILAGIATPIIGHY
jgi:hypothetical protein